MFGSDAGGSIFSADADGLLESEESSDGPPAVGADCCELTPELLALLGLPADAFGDRTLVPDVELLHHIRTCSEHPEPPPPAPRERVHSLGARRAETVPTRVPSNPLPPLARVTSIDRQRTRTAPASVFADSMLSLIHI